MWHGRCSDRDLAEAFNHIFEPESAIESITEPGQIARQMLLTDRTVAAVDGGFDITDRGIDPSQCFPKSWSSRQPMERASGALRSLSKQLRNCGKNWREGCSAGNLSKG